MVTDSFTTGDVGDTVVNVPLNINQITFLVAGLRDLASHLDTTKNDDPDLDVLDRTNAQHNRELADYLERMYQG